MILKTEYTVAGIIIALLIGSGAGYIYGQSPIAGYKEEVDRLEAENLGIREKKAQLLEENAALQYQLDVLTENITITRSLFEEIQGKLEETKKDYEVLQLSYEAIKEDYDKLRECVPSGVEILYSEMKKAPEGYIKHDLIGVCGQDYLLSAPVNSDIWEVNITIISKLSSQPVHINVYKVIEDYPLDWLGQPFAPYARGEGEASISLTLNTSYAYVISIRDAYAKPFTGFIEESWCLKEETRVGEWNILRVYEGSGGLTTDYFNITRSELRLTWNFTRSGSELDMMNFLLYSQGTDKINWNAGIIRDSSGTTYIHNIVPGLYYLKITNDRSITNWTVVLEIWIPENITEVKGYTQPNIDGYIEGNEWPAFHFSTLKYFHTYNQGIRDDSIIWDREDKGFLYSTFIYNDYLYTCVLINDDYINKDYQIRSLHLYLNGYCKTTVFITYEKSYRLNSWATYGAITQYSHTSNGEYGLNGYYIIEIKYPLNGLEVSDFSYDYGETTRWLTSGTADKSTYWNSDLYYFNK